MDIKTIMESISDEGIKNLTVRTIISDEGLKTPTIKENISDEAFKTPTVKKSILVDRTRTNSDDPSEIKRDNSKAQIQWKEVPKKADEEVKKVKTSFPAIGILMGRGCRWHYIHDAMLKLRSEGLKQAKQSDEAFSGARKKAINTLIQDLGSGALQKRYNKNAELTLDQQTHLEIMKHKIERENDIYLRHHPEIDIMIRLVFGALFKNRPQCPKQFVSDYVHHLNKHREELVVVDVDVPFDRPVIPEEISSEEEERRMIADFARKIVESCINLASLGQSYVDVMGIIKSLLRVVSPSEEEISVESSITNAEVAVSEILMSLLRSVILQRSTSAEVIADELLNVVLSNALPFIPRDSGVYAEMRKSVETFIEGLVEQMTEKLMKKISLKEITDESSLKTSEGGTGRPILKKEISEMSLNKFKTKVKFQSL